LVVILNPFWFSNLEAIELNEEIDLSELPKVRDTEARIEKNEELLLCFFSTTCTHCTNAAKRVAIAATQRKLVQIYYVMNGEEAEVDSFLLESKSSFPVIIWNDRRFWEWCQGDIPSIFYVKNQRLKKKWVGEFFDVDQLPVQTTNGR